MPIILIGFAALAGAKIPPEVSAWIAVFILPLNSAVNPLLYTISAIECGGKYVLCFEYTFQCSKIKHEFSDSSKVTISIR